jgi:hypothetical protein
MSMLALRKVLLVKEESEYGTDPTPTPAANTIDAEGITYNPQPEMKERNPVRSYLSKVAGVIGKRYAEIKFTVFLKGSGTAGTAGRLGDLLEACGYIESADVGSSVVYSPTSLPVSTKSVTLYFYQLDSASAILKKITGARGTYQLALLPGDIAKCDFTFRGKYNAPEDVAVPTGMAFESTTPPIVESSAFTFGGTSLVTREVQLTLNNELTARDDINSAAGVAGIEITDRKPTGSFKPEAVLLATKNYDTLLTANTESALRMTVGAVAGNKIDIVVPKAQVEQVNEDAQNNIAYQDIPFRCNGSSGDDEITFKFY